MTKPTPPTFIQALHLAVDPLRGAGLRRELMLLIAVHSARGFLVWPLLYSTKRFFVACLLEPAPGPMITYGSGMLLCSMLFRVLTLSGMRRSILLASQVTQTLRLRLLDVLLSAPYRALSGRHRAEFSHAFQSEAAEVGRQLFTLLATVVQEAFPIGSLLVALGWLHPTLLVTFLCCAPFLVLPQVFLRDSVLQAQDEVRGSRRALAQANRRVVSCLDQVRLRTVRRDELAQLEVLMADEVVANTGHRIARERVHQAAGLVALGLMAGATTLASLAASPREGHTAFLVLVLMLLFGRVQRAVQGVTAMAEGSASLASIGEFLALAPEPQRPGARLPKRLTRLEMDAVTFRFLPKVPVLDQASLTLEPGELVSLTGPNGAGKTTLLLLLAGLLEPDSGELRANGQAYSALDIEELRRDFGMVLQQPELLPGTIRDNLALGRPEATEDDLREALELAGAQGIVDRCPDGLDTQVDPSATTLSGGERQKLALARAMVGRPRILLLDEPGNHLQRKTTRQFLDRLRALDEPPGTLLVTHDPNLAALADRRLALVDGELQVVEGQQPEGPREPAPA